MKIPLRFSVFLFSKKFIFLEFHKFLRDFSKNYSSKIRGKAVILAGRARLLDDIDDFVESYNGKIFVDKSTINANDYN